MASKIQELKMWKKRPVVIFTAFFVLLQFFLIIKIVLPCKEYQYEGSYFFEPGISTENTVIYDGIGLSPGIYQISLDFETDTDQVAFCNVQDSTVCTGALLSNGEHLYRYGEIGYAIWLYERTDDLQVTISYGGGQPDHRRPDYHRDQSALDYVLYDCSIFGRNCLCPNVFLLL